MDACRSWPGHPAEKGLDLTRSFICFTKRWNDEEEFHFYPSRRPSSTETFLTRQLEAAMRRVNANWTHGVSGECSQHDGGEALVEGGHALLPDQLPQDVTEAVGILSFWGCRAKRMRNKQKMRLFIFQCRSESGLFRTGSLLYSGKYWLTARYRHLYLIKLLLSLLFLKTNEKKTIKCTIPPPAETWMFKNYLVIMCIIMSS